MAVTVTYLFPTAGLVAPAAADVANQVSAAVEATADADANAVITHNMGLTAAELAQGYPTVVLEPMLAEAQVSLWNVTAKAANTVTVTKGVGVGSGGAGDQLTVVIRRPQSIFK